MQNVQHILIAPKVSFRCGPKLQRVRGKDVFHGVVLTEGTSRRTGKVPLTELTGAVCRDLIDRLTLRFDIDDGIVAATSLADKNTWPATIEEAKGLIK